jgi:hypothetical protein
MIMEENVTFGGPCELRRILQIENLTISIVTKIIKRKIKCGQLS